MLVKTRGIVLNFIKYRETSIIARVYTEKLGLQTYIVNSIRKKGPLARIALFQPFTLLDMVVYASAKGGITRISEYKCAYPFQSIPFNIYKSSITLFLSEVISMAVKEEEENPVLFGFLYNAILHFDRQEKGFENFHLTFLLQFAHYLGFGVNQASEITTQVAFSGQPGLGIQPSVLHFQLFDTLLQNLLDNPETAEIPNGKVRRELLQLLVRFYQLHVEKLGEIKSLQVLSEVLSD